MTAISSQSIPASTLNIADEINKEADKNDIRFRIFDSPGMRQVMPITKEVDQPAVSLHSFLNKGRECVGPNTANQNGSLVMQLSGTVVFNNLLNVSTVSEEDKPKLESIRKINSLMINYLLPKMSQHTSTKDVLKDMVRDFEVSSIVPSVVKV